MAEYLTPIQNNYGFPLTFDATGKLPLIAKRIFATYKDANDYVNDKDSSAIPGLTITVIYDTDADKNGVYFVKQANGYSGETTGLLEKLGTSEGTSVLKRH